MVSRFDRKLRARLFRAWRSLRLDRRFYRALTERARYRLELVRKDQALRHLRKTLGLEQGVKKAWWLIRLWKERRARRVKAVSYAWMATFAASRMFFRKRAVRAVAFKLAKLLRTTFKYWRDFEADAPVMPWEKLSQFGKGKLNEPEDET
jgi:hypothetical protein